MPNAFRNGTVHHLLGSLFLSAREFQHFEKILQTKRKIGQAGTADAGIE